MTEHRQEISFLKGFLKITQSPEQCASKYKILSLVIGLSSVALLLLSFYLASQDFLSTPECLILAFIAGLGGGFSTFYRLSSAQIPLHSKYYIAKTDDIQSRLKELETSA